jgi:hypothetical protein
MGATGLAMATGWQTIAVIFRQTVGGSIQVEAKRESSGNNRANNQDGSNRGAGKCGNNSEMEALSAATIRMEAMGKIGAGNRRQQSGGRLQKVGY